MNVLIGFLLLAYVSAKIADYAVLYPGYVSNFVTDKNKEDDHYLFVPITGVGADTDWFVQLEFHLSIDSSNPFKPSESVYLSNRTLPDFTSGQLILQNDNDYKFLKNYTNGFYWIGAAADCGTGVDSKCKDNVEAEISLYTVFNNNSAYHWPPYSLLNQRRTAKFSLPYTRWIYYWLTVTNDDLDSAGVFNLYLGVQFYSDGDNSAVQMSLWEPTDPWPTATVNGTNGAKEWYPKSPLQKGDWIQSAPWGILVGMWKVAAQSTVNNDAQFTIKAGFNAPPKQAANLNASFSRVGLLTLIVLGIMKHLL